MCQGRGPIRDAMVSRLDSGPVVIDVGISQRAPALCKDCTVTSDNEQLAKSVAQNEKKTDWIYTGSLVLTAISLLGIAYIAWTHYGF